MAVALADYPGRAADSGAAMALIKGGGEVGTAAALTLWRAGWRVVVAELQRPTVLRRQLSLAEAAFAGSVTRQGVRAIRVTTPGEAVAAALESAAIPLYLGPVPPLAAALQPALVVDARMRRGGAPERQRHEAPLVVGLGPGLIAGRDVDLVVETCPGPDLGRILRAGAARPYVPLQRRPRAAGAEQYVRAPGAGPWRTERAIGDVLVAGELLGWLGDAPVRAPVGGCLRGLVHDGVTARAGLKLAAVHPGDWQRKEAGIGYRARAIGTAVLALATEGRAVWAVPALGMDAAPPAAAS